MLNMPTRTYTHVIDTKAIKKVLNSLPDTWVVRELTERDYGTDLQVEIFRENGFDAKGHQKYETSGCLVNLQVKGQDSHLPISKNNAITFRLHRNNLMYFERFSVPFILIYVDVSDESADSYFVWLQKYIKIKLDQDHPQWRNETLYNKKGEIKAPKYKIEIPLDNSLASCLPKLRKIASQAKFSEEALEFMEVFTDMKEVMEFTDTGFNHADDEAYRDLSSKALRLSRLSTLMEFNESLVDRKLLSDLSFFLTGFISSKDFSLGKLMAFEGMKKLESLSNVELSSLIFFEEKKGEMLGEYPY